jgi:hypothetical protein
MEDHGIGEDGAEELDMPVGQDQPQPRRSEPSPSFGVRPAGKVAQVVTAQSPDASCPTCGAVEPDVQRTPPSYVYSLGQIEARFPNPSVEKEFAQATGRGEAVTGTDLEAFHKALSLRENRHLVRQMCWVLRVQGFETYLLRPADPLDFDLLVAAIEPREAPPISLVVGTRGPIAPPDYCNGLMIPIVIFDQIYTFPREELVSAIPRPDSIPEKQFGAAARELFDRIMQMTDNAGSTDEHRALNYLSVRYPAIYARVADSYGQGASLTSVETRVSSVSATRKIMDVIFSFTNRKSDFVEKYFVRVDVTDEFPFLVSKLSPYYDLN